MLRALTALHSAGYAHRNIKPSNILRRPQKHDWMLSDFGCSAPIGALRPWRPWAQESLLQSANAGTATQPHQLQWLRILSSWWSLAAVSAFADHNSTLHTFLRRRLRLCAVPDHFPACFLT